MKITTRYNKGLLERIEKVSDVTWLTGQRAKEGTTIPSMTERVTLSDETLGHHLYYSCTPIPEPGYTVVDNDEFVRQCAKIAPKKETKGWECKNTPFILDMIAAKSDVKWWGTGDSPSFRQPSASYLQLWDGGALTHHGCGRDPNFEFVTPEEFVAKCAKLKPKNPTLEEVCRPVIEWLADNEPELAINIDETDAELYDPKAIKRVTL